MRYNKGTLQKIEDLFKELRYTVRYEKGNFKSGYCLVEQRKVVVVNKFYEIEERINSLLDVLSRVVLDRDTLSETGLKTLQSAFAAVESRVAAAAETLQDVTAATPEDISITT